MNNILEKEIKSGKIIPTKILDSDYLFLRKATPKEKKDNGHNDHRGYSWYICSCGNYVLKRNDSKPKECNCNKNRGKRKITDIEKQEIISYYKSSPMTENQVAEHFNISNPSVIKILSNSNTPIWNKAQIFSPNLNEHYFDNIDSEYKAYFLGLMITDGNIFDNYKSSNHQANVNLTLQEQDKYILEKFKQELKCNKKITSDGRGCYQLSVMSNILKTGLAKYGVVPNKTFITEFPQIDRALYPHLLRGIFDGDGSVGFYARPNRKVHVKSIKLCSANKKFLKNIQDFLQTAINIPANKINQDKENLWSIGYGSKNSLEKLIHYLYDNATIYLTRKKDKCDLILEEISKYRDN